MCKPIYTRKPAAHVAAPIPTNPSIPPPGPDSFDARLAVARASAKPGEGLRFWVARKNDPSMTIAPMLLLWSMPGWQIDGKNFWDDARPHVIRAWAGGKHAVEMRPLLFLVRPGHEWEDFIGLVKQIERDGERYDAPVQNIFDWMPEDLGRGQFVALLDDETEGAA